MSKSTTALPTENAQLSQGDMTAETAPTSANPVPDASMGAVATPEKKDKKTNVGGSVTHLTTKGKKPKFGGQ